ncbi:hypothetical protein DXG01_005358 [Tephrocybe rancida]|nr:hypothetical protein DXG01_005358 [Tephrocybe rancida]
MSNSQSEEWKLDPTFLEKLNRWAEENPKTSLEKILGQVSDAIDLGQPFFELVPDGSFPARGLVKGLAHLVKLGKTVTSAQRDILLFTEDVVRWVTTIQQEFSAGQKNPARVSTDFLLLLSAKPLINSVNGRLVFWYVLCASAPDESINIVRQSSNPSLLQRLKASREIGNFKQQLTDAREVLREVLIINQSRMTNAILKYLRVLSRGQKEIIQKIDSLNIRSHLEDIERRLKAEADGRRAAEIAAERRREIGHILSQRVVVDPTHDAQGKRPCDEDTRTEILTEVNSWANDISSGSSNFLWLTGDPGCGKSAITASLAEATRGNTTLWAEFFINRNNPNTTNPSSYFPTIVHQFAKRSLPARDEIYDQLTSDEASSLAGLPSERAGELFVKAIQIACAADPSKPVVIIIDGLDETDRKYLGSTAIIFARLFSSLSDCVNAKIFISSRTEDEIRNPFVRSMQGNALVKHVHLDTRASFSDVDSYLRKNMEQIWLHHLLPAEMWPREEGLAMLAKHASGLFI